MKGVIQAISGYIGSLSTYYQLTQGTSLASSMTRAMSSKFHLYGKAYPCNFAFHHVVNNTTKLDNKSVKPIIASANVVQISLTRTVGMTLHFVDVLDNN